MEAAGKHQVLIFVHSRKETAKTARFIKDTAMAGEVVARILSPDSASFRILEEEAANCKSTDLRDLMPFGIAIHHAGMDRMDRRLVEDLFHEKHVQVGEGGAGRMGHDGNTVLQAFWCVDMAALPANSHVVLKVLCF